MFRLRTAARPTVTLEAVLLELVVLACAGVAAVILSAVCAMMVPRPTMNAARIIMLRITPHSRGRKYHHIRCQAATNGGAEGCHFDEKDERSVNGDSAAPGAPELFTHCRCAETFETGGISR
jgi:hypothetical protein